MLFDTAFLKKHGLFALASLCFLAVFFKNAWVADDAYIAFRSVEQVFAGNGPRWNMDERVQVYTSPLWFGLLLVGKLLVNDLFLASILLSALCCIGMLVILRQLIGDDMRWCAALALLLGSWSMMDFTSSGLENPLLYLLTAFFLYHYFSFFRQDADPSGHLKGLLLALGLLAVTRHDVATLALLPSLYVFYRECRQRGISTLLKYSYRLWLPLLLWTIFSVIYYGVPFPNTAYAKMMHGIPRRELMEFGELYLLVSIRWDYFAQSAVLLLALAIVWTRSVPLAMLGAGIVLNLFYVVYVGGDFMQGRFVSLPLFAAVVGAMALLPLGPWQGRGLLLALMALLLLLNGPVRLPASSGFDMSQGRRHFSWNGILNERNFYFKTNSFYAWWHRDRREPFPHHKWCLMGAHATQSGKQISDFGGIGMYGYCAGLELVVIDNLALGEPFLARLPKPPGREWRAGHFHRDFPRGYYESRLSGLNQLQDSRLAALWNDVVLLTRAPLWTRERWQAIWRLNSGYYRDIAPYYFADIAAKNLP